MVYYLSMAWIANIECSEFESTTESNEVKGKWCLSLRLSLLKISKSVSIN